MVDTVMGAEGVRGFRHNIVRPGHAFTPLDDIRVPREMAARYPQAS